MYNYFLYDKFPDEADRDDNPSTIENADEIYPHLLVQLLAVGFGWMKVSGDFKINISPRLEAILVVIVLHDFKGNNKNVTIITLANYFNLINIYRCH